MGLPFDARGFRRRVVRRPDFSQRRDAARIASRRTESFERTGRHAHPVQRICIVKPVDGIDYRTFAYAVEPAISLV